MRAPGKVNLSLRVGAVQDDGYHPLVTVFQAVSLAEEVTLTERAAGAGILVEVTGPASDGVPTDRTNLAWQAVELVAERAGVDPDVHVELHKGVPVGGGMAGGSADAAAALVAADHLLHAGLSRDELHELAARLGSDVPFGLLGHVAVGTGRGHLLTPAMTRGELHWALGTRARGLSTAEVYRTFDERGPGDGSSAAEREPVHVDQDAELLQALGAGDTEGVGRALHNDLQAAALHLAPELADVLTVAERAGTLGAIVSGSGPTVAALARSPRHARAIGAAWTAAGVVDGVHVASGPTHGARIVHSVASDGPPRP
ncbi:4-(cytidine 5'-diphospho)-2-C-methyl-D-erythritol kinase [Paraoerskovia sediminicola]|uniref:4-(cytidine 5'-diphospho)-2-C-methyl-D-erythritol kinase n=1 Tax=Paraoerskovia sediminicola TaxID=1138587 RepID=UPI002572A2C2|nr:4-(cytidine 5'-diphospho)-2-C-methyl-D-erythritol kinase [Paraoerskovia sediminicola]